MYISLTFQNQCYKIYTLAFPFDLRCESVTYNIIMLLNSIKHDYPQVVRVITQDEYDILVITQVRGEAEDEC